MSVTDAPVDAAVDRPTVELEWRYDDADDPAELTVYAPEDARRLTEWVTVDCETAVPLDQVR